MMGTSLGAWLSLSFGTPWGVPLLLSWSKLHDIQTFIPICVVVPTIFLCNPIFHLFCSCFIGIWQRYFFKLFQTNQSSSFWDVSGESETWKQLRSGHTHDQQVYHKSQLLGGHQIPNLDLSRSLPSWAEIHRLEPFGRHMFTMQEIPRCSRYVALSLRVCTLNRFGWGCNIYGFSIYCSYLHTWDLATSQGCEYIKFSISPMGPCRNFRSNQDDNTEIKHQKGQQRLSNKFSINLQVPSANRSVCPSPDCWWWAFCDPQLYKAGSFEGDQWWNIPVRIKVRSL